jgi:single-strand DNA-binding protein
MAGTYQKTLVLGRLGRDPELRYTPNGTPVCQISVATDEGYKDREGNQVDRTEWHRIQAWRKQAENLCQYKKKGDLLLIEGKLQTRKFTDREGVERSVTEIRAERIHFMPDGRSNGQRSVLPTEDGADDHGPAFPSDSSQMDEPPF